MTRLKKNSLRDIQSLANLIPDPERAEDATDWCGRLLYEERAEVWINEVEDGLEPSWWTAWDELDEDGVAKGCFVSRGERDE